MDAIPNGLKVVKAAIEVAKAVTNKPSIIACKTTIGYGSPNKAGMCASLWIGAAAQLAWETFFEKYAVEYPEEAAAFKAAMADELPDGWEASLPEFGLEETMATRAAPGKVLAKIVPAVPALLGGSADLTGSNKTDVKGAWLPQEGEF